MKKVLLIHSSDGPAPPVFSHAGETGKLVVVRQDELTDEAILRSAGLITCASVDQIDLHERRNALESLLDGGGRIVLSCQVQRPFLDGVKNFIPIERPKRADYVLTRLSDHPILSGIAVIDLEKRNGVAGFYGRGYNPPPSGAVAITGLGPNFLPVDWEWRKPSGGRVFAHAGNNLWVLGDDRRIQQLLADRMVAWCAEDREGD